MQTKDLLTHQRKPQFRILKTQPASRRFRIIPEWEKDASLQKVEPKESHKESFMVRRKEEIQLNRWKTITKQISTIEDERDKNIESFRRNMLVKIDRCKEGKLLKFVGLGKSQQLTGINESFRRERNLSHIVRKVQPYWKNYKNEMN